MTIDKKVMETEAVDTQIRFRAGQYINKAFLVNEGFEFKCTAGNKYELWFSTHENIIVENLHENHCIVYKVFLR